MNPVEHIHESHQMGKPQFMVYRRTDGGRAKVYRVVECNLCGALWATAGSALLVDSSLKEPCRFALEEVHDSS